MDETRLEQLLSTDFSTDTAHLRDRILPRCLEELDSDAGAIPLDDSELDMLAAAGDPNACFVLDRPNR